VDLVVSRLQPFVDAVKFDGLFRQAVVVFANPQEGAGLGEQLAGGKRAQQIGVGSALQAGQARGRRRVAGDEQDRHEVVAGKSAETPAKLQGQAGFRAAVEHNERVSRVLVRV